jgi:prepilin-type N-terminal cleavage/methylation domain-containing protein
MSSRTVTNRANVSGGFTLVEVLVSMSVVLLALSYVPATMRTTAHATVLARDGTRAVALAQAKLEELIVEAPRELGDAGGFRAEGSDTITASGMTPFHRSWRVSTDPQSPATLSLSVTVTWDPGHLVHLATSTRRR